LTLARKFGKHSESYTKAWNRKMSRRCAGVLCPKGGGRNLRSWVARQRSVRLGGRRLPTAAGKCGKAMALALKDFRSPRRVGVPPGRSSRSTRQSSSFSSRRQPENWYSAASLHAGILAREKGAWISLWSAWASTPTVKAVRSGLSQPGTGRTLRPGIRPKSRASAVATPNPRLMAVAPTIRSWTPTI